MYADIFGTLPVAEAPVAGGAGLGTVPAFMMGVTALSLPSIILIGRMVRLPLLAAFAGVVTLGNVGNPDHRLGLQCRQRLVHLKGCITIGKILGSGCRKCVALAGNAKAAAHAAGKPADIVKVSDVAEIATRGVMSTPGLVVDERRVPSGKVLKAEEIGKLP